MEASARPRRRSSLKEGTTDGNGNAAFIEIPYLEKMRWVCKDLGYEEEYADIVGSRLLDIEGADYNTTTVNGEVPTLDTVVDFLAHAFLCFTRHAGVVLVTADDIQWMDTLSFNVLEELFEQGEDLLLLCSARDSERSSKLRISEAKKWGGEDGKFRFRQIPVAPLEMNDMKYLIARVLGQVESAIDDEFCEQLHERSGGGVPVFCIELLDHIRRNMLYEIDEKGTVCLHLDKHGEQVRYIFIVSYRTCMKISFPYQQLTSFTVRHTESLSIHDSQNMAAEASLTKFFSSDLIPLTFMSARSYNAVQF